MTGNEQPERPAAWAVLERAVTEMKPVQVNYGGHRRVISPHALGWKNHRPKLLAYQNSGTTSTGNLPADPRQRWRSMYVDQIENPVIIDGPWQTADNHTTISNCIDELEIRAPNPEH